MIEIETPLISVIIPVYNSIQFLDRLFQCLNQQTFKRLEIILIDDGSIDGSSIKCDNLASIDSRIKVIHKKNSGVADARNLGLKIASCDIIGFIDNDDWIHPQYFELLYKSLISSNVEMVMCQFKIVKDNKIFSDSEIHNNLIPLHLNADDLVISLFKGTEYGPINLHTPFCMVWGKLYKKAILKDLYFKNLIGEDIEFNYHVYRRLKSCLLLPINLYLWVQHTNSQHCVRKIQSNLECYYNIYQAISIDNISDNSIVLKRLYISLLATRYNIKKFEIYKSNKIHFENLISKIIPKENKSLILNKKINLKFKIAVLVFYYVPFTYNFFRYILSKNNDMLRKFKF